MKILEIFRKFIKRFSLRYYVRRTDREKDGIYDSKNRISLRHYKCFAHLQKTCEISGLPTDSVVDITLLSLRSTQLNTRSIG